MYIIFSISLVTMTQWTHLFPSRTEKLSAVVPKVLSGDDDAVDTPLSIPNREVKRCSAEGIALQENRKSLGFLF